MNPLEQALERICLLGCERVNACIVALQNGETWSEYAGLDGQQRSALLLELQSIMSVYSDEG